MYVLLPGVDTTPIDAAAGNGHRDRRVDHWQRVFPHHGVDPGRCGASEETEIVTEVGSALIVVDAANVIGSRPDGWWRDRPGAARRLLTAIVGLRDRNSRFDEVVVVLEGAAKAAVTGMPDLHVNAVRVVLADGSGDDAIVRVVSAAQGSSRYHSTTVVTADRGLRRRVEELGATTVGPRWLLGRIESV